jgi:hypothetical protein
MITHHWPLTPVVDLAWVTCRGAVSVHNHFLVRYESESVRERGAKRRVRRANVRFRERSRSLGEGDLNWTML